MTRLPASRWTLDDEVIWGHVSVVASTLAIRNVSLEIDRRDADRMLLREEHRYWADCEEPAMCPAHFLYPVHWWEIVQ